MPQDRQPVQLTDGQVRLVLRMALQLLDAEPPGGDTPSQHRRMQAIELARVMRAELVARRKP